MRRIAVLTMAAVVLVGCGRDEEQTKQPPGREPRAARPEMPSRSATTALSARPATTTPATGPVVVAHEPPPLEPKPAPETEPATETKPAQDKKISIGPNQMACICDVCGTLFVREIGEEDSIETEMGAAMDCPKCGKKKCAYLAVKCPNCGKYYVPDSHRAMAKLMENPDLAPSEELLNPKDVCPHCGTDRIQWYREHRRRRR